ncbi:nucleolus and neural progenitor protein [Pygocentrus nattereri]|uniref:Nucleolus and neural progenitor protein-like N-terminal domain-containing protein n=1 Tax=Pygocentrus nattereri TaxID=42514 RepID=A0A3B4D600_PYGNA|nr:nucleolus and neural progenitor protein [Pygocentrus nattereri]
MAVDPWNRVNIPYPGAASTSRIRFDDATASTVEGVVSQAGGVLKLLGSELLRTEVRVLYEIVYVVNNNLRQHKPFRALKQVQQCIKRLNEMNLRRALRDLQELCPNKMQRHVGVETGHCVVPSQPMLEWICLKLLGASNLMVRTLDQCTKAFSLIRQHLRLAEFIVLNLVLASMVSRLWVYFRGVLNALVPVYQGTLELRHQVAQCRPMAYLTDYTLPGDLESFLSPPDSYLLWKGGRAEAVRVERAESSVLERLFQEGEEEQVEDARGEEREMMQMLAVEGRTKSSMDLGMAVLRKDPRYTSSSSGLDIKTMLQGTHGVTKQCVVDVFQMSTSTGDATSEPALDQQKRVFLKLLRNTSSFSEMAVQLKEIMGWCKKCKLRQERQHLAVLFLQCQRMKVLDGEGISVRRKLRRMCERIRRVMFKGTGASLQQSSHLWRTRCCLRSRFTTLVARYGSFRNRVRVARPRSRIARDLFGATAKSFKTVRKDMNVSSDEQFQKKPSRINDIEIDDIFASFGL